MEETILLEALQDLYSACLDILTPLHEQLDGNEEYQLFGEALGRAQDTIQKIKFG